MRWGLGWPHPSPTFFRAGETILYDSCVLSDFQARSCSTSFDYDFHRIILSEALLFTSFEIFSYATILQSCASHDGYALAFKF